MLPPPRSGPEAQRERPPAGPLRRGWLAAGRGARATRRGWRRFREATDRYRLLRDVVGGILLVLLIVGGLSLLTGGKWPPLVVVESGSMMHPAVETSYGRFGTIDVGDIVFLRDHGGADQIRLWVDGGEENYGRPGDVIAFAANGDRANETLPTVIHRAITWVEVSRSTDGLTRYRVLWVDGEVKEFGPQGIYFPALGFHETYGFTPTNGYRPEYSGFITKGDNPFTNPATDQALGITRVVDPTWIEGRIYGELPWMGLAKLTLQSGRTNPEVPGWERIGNAFAPIELWSMFFLVVALLILVPFSLDTWRVWRRERVRRRLERIAAEEAAAARRERARQEAAKPPTLPPQPPARKAPATFTPVTRDPSRK